MNMRNETETAADYIIVGSGSAGAVVAARLAENPAINVLLIEAGGSNRRMLVDMPAGTLKLMANATSDWMYHVEADTTRGDIEQVWSGGKMLGGSSSINGMVYCRGEKRDFDDWAAMGCTGWAANDIWPLFLKSEKFHGPPSQDHGTSGPLGVAPVRSQHPLTENFVSACDEVGLPRRDDYCDGHEFGSFHIWTTTAGGQRSNTFSAFVSPLLDRPNLAVVTGVTIDRIECEDGRAVRVVGSRNGEPYCAAARREIVISAGTIGSPAILMRSGIGPAAHLRELGIDILADLPVGENLQEHAVLAVSKLVTMPTYNMAPKLSNLPRHVANYLLFRKGPLTSPAVQAMAYARTEAHLADPDVCFSFIPLAMDLSGQPKLHARSGVTIGGQICRPNARGKITLQSRDHLAPPKIALNMLEDAEDIRTLTKVGRLAEQIFAAPAFAPFVEARNEPPQPIMSDEGWLDYLRQRVGIGYHPVGTCRMGREGESVLDPQLRVRGIDGLRVIDASIMPRITSGNTNAPSMMIGERGAELILRSLKV
ncbi:GMC family oxidoreductase [Sphingobium sp. EM0848]|uniref:GMC family oxidoreductase n=1 Tax=Sphingobium sp. EM0848 TaxID=2743473 RepID=UPI00159BFB16|nr:GMC family oxidoreductase N-terminal domain-containing protein [Sphingobium sp. EM0848]